MRRTTAMVGAAVFAVVAVSLGSPAAAQSIDKGFTTKLTVDRVGCASLLLTVPDAQAVDSVTLSVSWPNATPVTYSGPGDAGATAWRHLMSGVDLPRTNTVAIVEITGGGAPPYVKFIVPSCQPALTVRAPSVYAGDVASSFTLPAPSKIITVKRLPVITGNAHVGGTLRGSSGTWGQAKRFINGGQWFRVVDGTAVLIKGAEGFEYRVKKGDRQILFRSWVAWVGYYGGLAFSRPITIR